MNSRISVPKIAAAACLGALVVAGCGSSSGKPSASAPPPTSAPTTTTRAPIQAVVSATDVRVIPGSATGKSPCEKASSPSRNALSASLMAENGTLNGSSEASAS